MVQNPYLNKVSVSVAFKGLKEDAVKNIKPCVALLASYVIMICSF